MADLAEIFTNIPIFSGFSREDVAKVLGKLEKKLFKPGETIKIKPEPRLVHLFDGDTGQRL